MTTPDLFTYAAEHQQTTGIGQGGHVNSQLAYYSRIYKDDSGRIPKIIEFLKNVKQATDREVMEGLGYNDPNTVRPRITKGIKDGWLKECGQRRCAVTGHRVRIVALV